MSTIHMVSPNELELHPDAGEVLEMSPDQYKEFRKAVKDAGHIREPLKRLRGTKVLIDGRHRRQVAIDLDWPRVPVVDVDLDGEDPVLYMLSSAKDRRHLTPGQRAAQGAKYMARLRKLAKERQKEGGKKGAALAGRGRPKEDPPAPDRGVAEVTQPKPARAPTSRDEAARLSGSSPKAVTAAEKVMEQSPEVFAQLAAGEITLPAAKKATELPKLEPAKSPLAHVKPASFAVTAKDHICATLHELNPCPFCGAKGDHLAALGGHSIVCHNCGAIGPNKSTENASRVAWNKRAREEKGKVAS